MKPDPRPAPPLVPSIVAGLLAAGLFIASAPARAQQGPPPEVRAAVSGVLELFASRGEAPLRRFADEAMAPAYRASFEEGALLEHLAAIRETGRGRTGDVEVRRRDDGALDLVLEGVRIVLGLDGDARVVRLEVAGEVAVEGTGAGTRADPGTDAAPPSFVGDDPLTWDGLADALRRAEAAGFSGVVLARRGGHELLREGYGLADRAAGRPMTPGLAFGIGSTPIDFTVAATRILAHRGDLDLDDPVGRHLDGVPADKAGLTIRHILDGRSGLPDFHDTADDWDPDLAWIDRDEAVRRILDQPLLFEPGTDEAHSHSAYVLLAAILEVASGTPYPDLVRSGILEPLGMDRTGFYGETLGLDLDDFAVGYGVSAMGLPNIPPNWGPTSWLVMGSGGMFSTPEDMDRFYRGLARGDLPGHEPGPTGPTALVNGSDRGFLVLYADSGHGDSVLLFSNAEGPGSGLPGLARAVVELVLGR